MYTQAEYEKMLKLQNTITNGLRSMDDKEDWFATYQHWSTKPRNVFDTLLQVTNSFNLDLAGNSFSLDMTNDQHIIDLSIISMSVFLSEHLLELSRKTFGLVKEERTRERKIALINHYFSVVDKINAMPELSSCIIFLNEYAEQQMVLHGKRNVDLYCCFYSLKELLRKRSTESIYLLFTLWRITHTKDTLRNVISSLVDYIQAYYDDFNRDPDMHLYYPLTGLTLIKRLSVITHWLELIAFHTNEISKKYQELNWIRPTDKMADDWISTNQISKFEMLQYKRLFPEDDEATIQKKAVCNHGYATWIKTVDIIYIVCDIFQTLYRFSDEELMSLHTDRAAVLEQYDNLTKIRDFYTRKIFYHQVYFQLERNYYESQVMSALEEDAAQISGSIDDVIQFISAIAADDIDGLMQAKQKYIAGIGLFASQEQAGDLDKLTAKIIEKIKEIIQRNDIYDELYGAVSTEFTPYLNTLARYPNIFSSLVSAEFLYKQYIENALPRTNFDYSCISIMYYMSLEDFLNKLIYTPYAKEVLSTIDKKDAKAFNWKNNVLWKDYVPDYTKFWKKGDPKSTCEIGPLGFLLDGIDGEPALQQFFSTKYNVTDFSSIKLFGQTLKNVAPRRNDAAHGGNYLSYTDVCVDKNNVYNTAESYRGMILQLLELLFRN